VKWITFFTPSLARRLPCEAQALLGWRKERYPLHAANSQFMPAPHRQWLVPGQQPGNQP